MQDNTSTSAVDQDDEKAVRDLIDRYARSAREGKKQVGWMRGTVCCRRTAEGWRIAHEHYSSPFDPQSMKMLTDLEP